MNRSGPPRSPAAISTFAGESLSFVARPLPTRTYGGATFAFFSCSFDISVSSFTVVASSGALSSRQRPVNRGNRIAKPAPSRSMPDPVRGLSVISVPRTM